MKKSLSMQVNESSKKKVANQIYVSELNINWEKALRIRHDSVYLDTPRSGMHFQEVFYVEPTSLPQLKLLK